MASGPVVQDASAGAGGSFLIHQPVIFLLFLATISVDPVGELASLL